MQSPVLLPQNLSNSDVYTYLPVILDDPYQFVERLPQECIKELLDSELQKMRQEKIEELEVGWNYCNK